MTTTGELYAIVEQLQLVDIGDAASYMGEEAIVGDEYLVSVQPAYIQVSDTVVHVLNCGCSICANKI